MKITVILCTYNRCCLLAAALESVAASVLPESIDWEVLVVDNNSDDQTREVVEDACRRSPGRFRYQLEPRQGKSHALNTGIARAKGDVLAFMDDDVEVEPNWLENLTAPLRDGRFAGSGGRVLPNWPTSLPSWLAPEGWSALGPLAAFDQGSDQHPLTDPPVGTNMAFEKTMFEKYGNFRTDLGPCPGSEIRNEDSEFGRRLLSAGERLCYEPSAVVHHFVAPERLHPEYFLVWWFDKARSDIRESGIPRDTPWLIGGVPLSCFRRLARWTLQWMSTFDSRRRFECKLKVWVNAGLIVECFRLRRGITEKIEMSAAKTLHKQV
jgi:glucosyl-dolichyl phosphate glucuronosyltransferase